MTETRTARLSLPQWSNGNPDGPSRSDFNEAFLNLETWAARDEQGTRAARPAAGIRGRYYTATDAGAKVTYRDDGAAWQAVGAFTEETSLLLTGAANIGLTVKAFASQTGDLTRWTDSSSIIVAKVDAKGTVFSGGAAIISADSTRGYSGFFLSTAAANKAAIFKGASSQSASITDWQDNSGASVASVNPTGRGTFVGVSSSSGVTVTSGTTTLLDLVAGTAALDATVIDSSSNSVPTLDVRGIAGQASVQVWRDASNVQVGSVSLAGAGQLVQMGAGGAAPAGTRLFAASGATGDRPLAVQAFAGQSASLFELLGSDGTTVLAKFANDASLTTTGNAGIGAAPIASTRLSVVVGTASNVAQVLQGASAQTGDLLQLQANGGTVLSRFTAGGDGALGGTQFANATLTVYPRATGSFGVVVKGLAAQTGALLRVVDNSNADLATVSSGGVGTFKGGLNSGSGTIPGSTNNLVQSLVAGNVVLALQGVTSQTGDLLRLLNPAGGTLSSFGSGGGLNAPTVSIVGTDANAVMLSVKGAAAQVAKLASFKDSANVEQLTVDKLGKVLIFPASDEATPLLKLRVQGAAAFPFIITDASDVQVARVGAIGDITARNITLSENFFNAITATNFTLSGAGDITSTGALASLHHGVVGNAVGGYVAGSVLTVRSNASADKTLYVIGTTAQTGKLTVWDNQNSGVGTTGECASVDTAGTITGRDFQIGTKSLPRGFIVEKVLAAPFGPTSGATEQTVTGLSQAVSVISGRRYAIHLNLRTTIDTATTAFSIRIKGSANSPAEIDKFDVNQQVLGGPGQLTWSLHGEFTATGTGTCTISITVQRSVGGNITVTDTMSEYRVHDVGEA